MQVQALTDKVNEAITMRKEDTAVLSRQVDILQRNLASLRRRNEKLSEQLGYLNEVAIRQAPHSPLT